jgi:hypothetical protein
MNSTPSPKTSGWALAWRFCVGHHMDGKRRTNYTFLHRATRDHTEHGRASRWAHRAGWERSAYRVGASATALAILYGYLAERTVTEDTVMGAVAACAVGSALRTRYAYRNAQHHRRVVRPLWQSTTIVTEPSTVRSDIHAPGDNHKKFITVPRNYHTDSNARVRLVVPLTWEARPQEVKRLTQLVERRLGGQWDSVTRLSAFPPVIEFVRSPSPPASLAFDEMRDALDRGKPSEIIIGKGTHNSVVGIDLDSESPHIAISMGTGGGKTTLLMLIVAYLMHHGTERVDIIDPKQVSHNWAKGIPGVHIHRTMAEQITAIAAFRARMQNRYDELNIDEYQVFPRQVLVIEEQNSWMKHAKSYWETYRGELDSNTRGRTPRVNPAIGDLAYCLFQGRQARMNIISVFQQMTANASGGGDMRENYGAKILARYSPQTWKMLVGTTPIPRSSTINGRARYALGGHDREVQLILITREQATEYALSGVRVVQGADALSCVSADGAGADDVPAMSLREMCDAGLIPVKYGAAKRARTRAGNAFPPGERTPVGILHQPSEVAEWFGNRSN